jgi:hypothetical protein
VATRLFADELAEVDRRADSAGLSRSAFQRAVLLADGDVCAVLRATIVEREDRIAILEEQARCFSFRIAGLESELDRARLRYARDVEGWLPSMEFERRERERWLTYG